MWDNNDHNRTLSNHGINTVKKMGLYLAEKGSPDLVISSTATRANTTANLAVDSGQWSCPIILERGIYGGSPSFLLDLVKGQNDNIKSICLVGHEPNFSDFIAQSISSNYIYFPTSSMAKINFDVKYWSDVGFDIGKLDWLINPKEIKEKID